MTFDEQRESRGMYARKEAAKPGPGWLIYIHVEESPQSPPRRRRSQLSCYYFHRESKSTPARLGSALTHKPLTVIRRGHMTTSCPVI